MKKMLKKCSTDQSCIRKRNTTYKIGTLTSGGGLKFVSLFKDIKRSFFPWAMNEHKKWFDWAQNASWIPNDDSVKIPKIN